MQNYSHPISADSEFCWEVHIFMTPLIAAYPMPLHWFFILVFSGEAAKRTSRESSHQRRQRRGRGSCHLAEDSVGSTCPGPRQEGRGRGERERERESEKHILGGAATSSEDFLTCFLKVPLPCLGSMAAAVQPNILGTLRKHFTKPNKWQPHLVEWFNKAFLWEWIFWSRAIK